jgi:hypothetical protein
MRKLTPGSYSAQVLCNYLTIHITLSYVLSLFIFRIFTMALQSASPLPVFFFCIGTSIYVSSGTPVCCGPWRLTKSSPIASGRWPLYDNFLFVLSSNTLRARRFIIVVVFLFSLFFPFWFSLFFAFIVIYPFNITIVYINLLKPSGNFTYHQV